MARMIIAVAASALLAFGAGARETAIYNGKLTSAMNAGGFAITNAAEPSAAGDLATKNYVDTHGSTDVGIVSNVAWNVIGAYAATGVVSRADFTNAVGEAVTKRVEVDFKWRAVEPLAEGLVVGGQPWWDGKATSAYNWIWNSGVKYGGMEYTWGDMNGERTATNLTFTSTDGPSFTATYGAGWTSNVWGLVSYWELSGIGGGGITTNDVWQITSNVVTKGYVESLGVSAGVSTNDVKAIVTERGVKSWILTNDWTCVTPERISNWRIYWGYATGQGEWLLDGIIDGEEHSLVNGGNTDKQALVISYANYNLTFNRVVLPTITTNVLGLVNYQELADASSMTISTITNRAVEIPSSFTDWILKSSTATITEWGISYNDVWKFSGVVDGEQTTANSSEANPNATNLIFYVGPYAKSAMFDRFPVPAVTTNILGFVNYTELADATNNLFDIVARNATWSAPNAFMVSATPIATTTRETISGEEIISHKVYSNTVETTTSGMSAKCGVEVTDEMTMDVPAVTWASLSSNGTITADGVFTATNDGIYRVSATTEGGVVKYADVAINADRVSVVTNRYGYWTDETGTVRKVINDQALATLNSATLISSNEWGGIKYAMYRTFAPNITGCDGMGIGCVYPTALSQHLMITAAHWGWGESGGQRHFVDNNSVTSSVTMGKWLYLEQWAKTNGFDEVAAKAAADIAIVMCDKSTAIPDDCIPYLMDMDTATEYFGEDWSGVSAWILPQEFEQAVPIVLTSSGQNYRGAPLTVGISVSGDMYGQSLNYLNYARADIRDRLEVMGQQHYIFGGDSGRPVFLMYGTKPILLGTLWSAASASNCTRAYEIIKKFVESYGDTIKNIKEVNQ